jgi:uncharacterized protein YqeY
MTIETLRQDMVAAMKAKDKATKDAISSIIAAVKKVAIDEGVREDIPESLVDRVILKELKRCSSTPLYKPPYCASRYLSLFLPSENRLPQST